MQYWIIRDSRTGWVLPMPPTGQNRGFTHMEPVDPEHYPGHPRLFNSPTAAKTALTFWRKGAGSTKGPRRRAKISWDFDYEGGVEYEVCPERLTAPMEIVPVTLTLPAVATAGESERAGAES